MVEQSIPKIWPDIDSCKECGWDLEKKRGHCWTHDATVWNGAEWSVVRHSTKLCTNGSCGLRYKLNYIARSGSKENIMTKTDNNPILLVHAQLGFTYNYLVQMWHRMCRAGVSAGAEAAVISLSYPDVIVGNASKAIQSVKDNQQLSGAILQAMFCFLRLQEGVFDFDINDPVPDGDEVFGVDNKGLHVIFNAARDDP